MATVSEIGWHKTTEGRCPQCWRIRALGLVNDGSNTEPRCIDCCFGHQWNIGKCVNHVVSFM